jgi:ABC-type transport system involved in cytochrome c biogenesis permease component
MTGAFGALLGVARHEYRMHVRRWSLWIVTALVVALTAWTGMFAFAPGHDPGSTARIVGGQAVSTNLLALAVVGALTADRWVRDGLLGVQELLDAQPVAPGIRLWGKYLGVTAASATPLAVIWAILTARIGLHEHQWQTAALAATAFAVITLPGLLFVAAFGIACPRVLGARPYQVLFVGYWFWGNLVPPHLMPTLAGTWLTPVGKYANAALFAHSDHALLLTGGANPVGAYASITLLIGISILLVTVFSVSQNRTAALSPRPSSDNFALPGRTS